MSQSIILREGKCGKAEWPCVCPVCPCVVHRMHVPTNRAGCNQWES